MDKNLDNFMSLRKNDFVEKMKNATDEDWALLDEALKRNWPEPTILVWALKVVAGETEINGNLTDVACTILYKVFLNFSYAYEVDKNTLNGLSKLLGNKEAKYKYARFRAARIILLLSDVILKNNISNDVLNEAVSVAREFVDDEDVGEIAKEDLSRMNCC
ncbi:MAG: hypothetical protein PHX25_02055 [Candidatus Pacebacteria bacterium]|nr:hypothetical protein [Candidatus Paceibacterota bacterium]